MVWTPYRINIQKGEPMLFPRKRIYIPQKTKPNLAKHIGVGGSQKGIEISRDQGISRVQSSLGYMIPLRAAISGLNGEALGSFRAMNHTYVAEIGQQDPSKKCNELHSFQSGHHFSEKKTNDNPMNPVKGQSLLGLTTLIWCLLLYRSIDGSWG